MSLFLCSQPGTNIYSPTMADTTSNLSVHPAPNKNGTQPDADGVTSEDLANRNYIRWDDSSVEKIPEGEEDDIRAVAEQINTIQKAQWNMHRHCYSGTHARTHGIVKGTFVVKDDLPKHLKQGPLFEKAGEYPVVCRYSTEPGDPGLDVRLLGPTVEIDVLE